MSSLDNSSTRKPPVSSTGIIGWLKFNLFSNWWNSLISVFTLYCLFQFIPWILDWTIFSADFVRNFLGEVVDDRTKCSRVIDPEVGGACWSIIYVRFYQFIYGFFIIS